MTDAALAEATELRTEAGAHHAREANCDRSVEDARILIVDDDPTAAHLMTRLLEREGFWRLVSAGGGWRGLAMMLQHPPDVMILDVNMPDLDGVQVLREVQRVERRTNAVTAVLAVSGNAAPATRHAMLDACADDFLPRPFAGAEFALRVRRLAQESRQLRRTVDYFDFLESGLTPE